MTRSRAAVIVYPRIKSVVAEKPDGSTWEHKFTTPAAIIGKADGSLAIKSARGKRLHKKFNFEGRREPFLVNPPEKNYWPGNRSGHVTAAIKGWDRRYSEGFRPKPKERKMRQPEALRRYHEGEITRAAYEFHGLPRSAAGKYFKHYNPPRKKRSAAQRKAWDRDSIKRFHESDEAGRIPTRPGNRHPWFRVRQRNAPRYNGPVTRPRRNPLLQILNPPARSRRLSTQAALDRQFENRRARAYTEQRQMGAPAKMAYARADAIARHHVLRPELPAWQDRMSYPSKRRLGPARENQPRKSTMRTGKMPPGLARYWATHKRKKRANPRRRRNPKGWFAERGRHQAAAMTGSAGPVYHPKHHKKNKENPMRKTRKHRRRAAPSGLRHNNFRRRRHSGRRRNPPNRIQFMSLGKQAAGVGVGIVAPSMILKMPGIPPMLIDSPLKRILAKLIVGYGVSRAADKFVSKDFGKMVLIGTASNILMADIMPRMLPQAGMGLAEGYEDLPMLSGGYNRGNALWEQEAVGEMPGEAGGMNEFPSEDVGNVNEFAEG